jgi:hypothetical protein
MDTALIDLAFARRVIGYRRNGDPIYEIAGGAVTAFWYGKAFLSFFNKEADIDTDTIKTMLTTSTYVPNQDTDQYKSSVTNEVSGTGYSAGGTTLTTPVQAYTGGTNVWNFDADDAVWSSSTITARIAVVYDSTPGTDATRPLISYVDFGGDNSTSSGTFTVQWAAAGIVKVTVS